MKKISLLPEIIANQIAAGEVIERPQSVVKELIENSLDAKANEIDISLKESGLEQITVSDNGEGMSEEDALLCVSRYATSKLRTIEDLHTIQSFGFRGEALAAIASVSKTTLTTKTSSDDLAIQLRIESGKIISAKKVGAQTGTHISIDNLFYNTPARLKFLKSPRLEKAIIEQDILAHALMNPKVSFTLHHNGHKVLSLKKIDSDYEFGHPLLQERAIACLGDEARDHIFPLSEKTNLLSISGYIIAPF